MSEDLDKLLYTALHGLLPLKRRTSLLRRYGGWSVLVPSIWLFAPLVLLIYLIGDAIKFYHGLLAAAGWWVFAVVLAGPVGTWFYRWQCRKIMPRIMAYLVRQGIRPHLCLNCEYDLKGSTSDKCPECGTALAPVLDEEDKEDDPSPRF